MNDKISVLFSSHKIISAQFTLYPLWMSKYRKNFSFFDNLTMLLKEDKNRKLVILGKFFKDIKPSERINFLESLRKRYNTLIFFEDNAGCESEYFDILPYFDLYFKKQVFKDKSLYFKPIYGNKLFTQYYFERFNVEMNPLPDQLPQPVDEIQLKKLRLAWNLGLGNYHSDHLFNKIHRFPKLFKWVGPKGIALSLGKFPSSKDCPSPVLKKCQARFDFKPHRSSIDYQRKLFLEKINDNPIFLQGTISNNDYKKELQVVQAVLSPFGFGEICYRDFEAILNGGVLVKPDMSHIETWPNIYVPNETYLPVSWDASDLVEKISHLLGNEELMIVLRRAAWDKLKESYAAIDDKVLDFITEINKLE